MISLKIYVIFQKRSFVSCLSPSAGCAAKCGTKGIYGVPRELQRLGSKNSIVLIMSFMGTTTIPWRH